MTEVYYVSGLTKCFSAGKVVANDDLSFSIEAGDVFGLLGPNGAGKTTLLKQMLGLIKPDSGSIRLFGREVTSDPTLPSKYVSCMSQRPNVLADLSVREALAVTGHLRGQLKAAARKEADALIEEFDLSAIASRLLGKLSGGQQRLVSFALTLTGQRPVLLLDEPTNDLDPTHRKVLWNKLGALNREQGTTIILVTHNVIEAERVLRTVGIINKGKIMVIGKTGDLKAQLDNRLRVEIRLKEQDEKFMSIAHGHIRRALPDADIAETPGAYVIMGNPNIAERAMQVVLQEIGIPNIEDFRVMQPTLEDVYLKLGGGEHLVKAHAIA